MTNRQKQCLLSYLGLYNGVIDGIWGARSREAEADFVRLYGEFSQANLLKALEKPADLWADIPNFTREEFRCKCGGKYCDGFPAEPSERLVRLAQRVRSHFDAPVIITSGVRCQTHNRNVGGVEGSWHRMGSAMDFTVRGVPGETVLKFVLEQPQIRYAYNIDGTCVHMDVGAP